MGAATRGAAILGGAILGTATGARETGAGAVRVGAACFADLGAAALTGETGVPNCTRTRPAAIATSRGRGFFMLARRWDEVAINLANRETSESRGLCKKSQKCFTKAESVVSERVGNSRKRVDSDPATA